MKKEYGKLSADQFRQLIWRLPELRRQQGEIDTLLANASKERFDALMVRDFNWASIYECSFTEHIAIVMMAFNKIEWLKEVAKASDPQECVLASVGLDDGPWLDIHPDFTRQDMVGLAYSLQRTILSVMLFRRSLSGLIQEVRDDDNIDSLFDAVRVDRAVLACPTIAGKIARAQLRNNKTFFLRLRNALKGPTRKHWAAYCDLRYSLFVLREFGLKDLSDDQLEGLLVHGLKVYPNTPSARRNLRAQYQRSRKIATI